MWFTLAASRFEAEAVKERDALAVRMAPEQVAEAQKQAAAWQPEPAKAPATSAAPGSAGPPPPKAIREAQQLLAVLGYEPDAGRAMGRTHGPSLSGVRTGREPAENGHPDPGCAQDHARQGTAGRGRVGPQAQARASAGCAAPGGQGRKPERAGSGPGCRSGR